MPSGPRQSDMRRWFQEVCQLRASQKFQQIKFSAFQECDLGQSETLGKHLQVAEVIENSLPGKFPYS